jgi:transcriptional regulator with XRE-family HTH domain
MSTNSANIESRIGKEVIMVPLDWVVMIAWDEKCGENLKLIRGNRSRRDVAKGVLSLGVECSQEYVRKLEQGKASSVSTKIVVALAKTLGVELVDIIPALRVEVSKLIGTLS